MVEEMEKPPSPAAGFQEEGKSVSCMQNWSSVISRLNFLKFNKNDKINYETCQKSPL